MTEYKEAVERRRLQIEADEWSKGVRSLHSHQLKSMWYDDRPGDTDNGPVMDIEYNNGIIVRHKNGKAFHTFGEALTGEALVDAYSSSQADIIKR